MAIQVVTLISNGSIPVGGSNQIDVVAPNGVSFQATNNAGAQQNDVSVEGSVDGVGWFFIDNFQPQAGLSKLINCGAAYPLVGHYRLNNTHGAAIPNQTVVVQIT